MRKNRLSRLLPFPILFLLLAAYNNCGIQRPGVDDSSYASVGYTHTGFEQSCVACHEGLRPAVVSNILHGNGADCFACHTSTNDLSLSGPLTTDTWSTHQSPYTHSTGITSCLNCHAPNRPAPVGGFAHYNNADCVSCHNPGSTNNTDGLTLAQIQSAFQTAYAYTHPAGLTNCRSCHEKNRPDPGHNPGQDCVSCHTTNNTWNNTLTDAQIQSIWNTSR